MLNLIHAAVRVFLDVLAVAFVLEHTHELHEKHREINDAPKQVAGVVDEPGENDRGADARVRSTQSTSRTSRGPAGRTCFGRYVCCLRIMARSLTRV